MTSETTSAQRLHKLFLRARIPASILMALAIIIFAHPSRESFMAGLVVIVIGELVRIWASGHIHKSAKVTTTGPYALVRHPLYLGHLLVATGFCIVSDSILAFIIVTISFFIVYMPTWKNEEKNLINLFGDTYVHFMEKRPALIPLRWSSDVSKGSFSWALVKQHREWNHVAALAGGALMMILLAWYHGSW
ncbi:isoprenylcysteine carboxylmethyltransferase family protein [Mariprofundus sp. NF]|uniref:methyltransferase family protein n=1 Tax=Mariprofundus sp. NF TaxID=2608716 RepID=UPI0015A29949|nr:isoprenylcysteine carboxylmethyltransferase family protein [Mariprofundus sp. NF]NWF39422.1 isoprenylcysteine carboxylmethyltransferase family protein [Mariprofundus sp. NF]